MIGENLSYFQITSKLGEGGMGEVWEATDTKLNRQVALKVLPEVFANDPQRMARFQREAQVLASLNHPNIAGIHGLEEAGGKKALVMELVEGEELSSLIGRGPLQIQDALRIALQIAEALEAAHEKGIIHRDLKPANIKIRPDGSAKVLDFGLAKALEGDPQTQANLTQSPTISMAATQAGIILGTAGYMSPEQARGQVVDKKADIWAFGVILFEMLAGQIAFNGDTISDVLASVLKLDIDWEMLPKNTPQSIKRLLRRCLEGQPKQRLHDIADARIEIEQYLTNPYEEADTALAATEARAPSSPKRKLLLVASFLGLAGLSIGLGWILHAFSLESPLPVKVQAALNSGDRVFLTQGSSAVLSPDGSKLAYITESGITGKVHLRHLDSLQGQELQGTEDAYNPFFSPDGRWIGFVTPTELKKVSVAGGTPLTLCKVSRSRGAAWGESGMIVISQSTLTGLSLVPAAGGEPSPLTELEEGELTHRWPQFLPGGEKVLFTSFKEADPNAGQIEVVDIDTKERTKIIEGGTYARYAASGHLLYLNSSTMFAAPFDISSLELQAMPAPVMQQVSMNRNGGGQYDVSLNGTLAFFAGAPAQVERILAVADPTGKVELVSETKRHYRWLRISPDGRRIAVEIYDDSQFDIWIHDLARDTQTRLTFSEGADIAPLWSQDGQYVYFGSQRDGTNGVFRKRADGAGGAERLTEDQGLAIPYGITSNGSHLSYHVNNNGELDIWILPLEADAKPFRLLENAFDDYDAVFSPDGKWTAYESDESERVEVYIRSFPGPSGKWQVSTNGGQMPRFSKDGRKLFFLGLDFSFWEASLTVQGDAIEVGRPRKLFDKPTGALEQEWEATAEGDKFYFVLTGETDEELMGPNLVNLMFNWLQEMERLLDAT